MSASSQPALDLGAIAAQLDRIAADSGARPHAPSDVQAVISAAVRLYASASEEVEIPPADAAVTTTDALNLACALLRSQDLTPFDMAMWFSRSQHRN